MPTLRNSIIKSILNHLQYGEYCPEDFDCNFTDDLTNLASITFRAHPSYSFTITEDYVGNSVTKAMAAMQGGGKKYLKTIEQPGAYKNLEIKVHDTIDNCIERIPDWVRRIRQDLIASKERYISELDEITDNFHKHIDAEIDDPESYFNDEEKNDLLHKLNNLQERVSDLERRFSLPEDKTKSINAAIDSSKKDIDIYTK